MTGKQAAMKYPLLSNGSVNSRRVVPSDRTARMAEYATVEYVMPLLSKITLN
jgi:hypothetical protein